MADELARLQRLLSRLRAILTDADSHPAKSSEGVAAWLRSLKGVAHDIDDVLEEFEYEDLRRKVEEQEGEKVEEGGSSGVCVGAADASLLPPVDQVRKFLPFLGACPLGEAMADRVADIWRRFNEIMEDKSALDVLGALDGEEADDDMESADNMEEEVKESTFSVSGAEMLGRDWEKDEMVGFLLGCPMDDLSVLAILGMGGLGKTMLALSVYHDGKVLGDFFDLKIWIHVSYDFDVQRITKQIAKQVADPEEMMYVTDDYDVLQTTVANKLRGKRFLLVLDDMWFEDGVFSNHKAWQSLCAPLICGEKGSKVVVTTRSTQVVSIMQPGKMIELEGLGSQDSWSLFKKHAFLDGNSGEHSNLERIGKEIVDKLNGVPLAIVTIASLLHFKSNEREWTSVLRSDLWELEQGEGDILPALRVSYEHLLPHLKPCFAFCCVYRKGREFDKSELVQLWMASGYVQSRHRRQMEEVGNDYLKCLVCRSLIQLVNGKYVVHDLLHDLGRSILQHDYSTVMSDQVHKITVEDQQKYHLSIIHKRVDARDLARLQNFWKLRSCIFVFYHKFTLQVPSSLFANMTRLRVLDLSGGGVHTITDSIGNLKHLRYLDLRRTPVKHLSESLCSLYMLQTLKLQECDQLGMLPRGMSNLINLRHLEAKEELVSEIFQIGKLVHLQGIDVFSISAGNGVRIEDLKDLNELRGRLCIRNLQRVGSKEEASQANLNSKKNINRLELEWIEDLNVNGRSSEVEQAVLDALVPPPRLKELTIKYYDGENFPCWMKHQFVSGLESISLCQCRRWDVLPPLLGVLPFLKKLEIAYFPQLIELPPLPSTLTNLRLDDVGLSALPELQELFLLQELIICNIPELGELPLLPTTLRVLTMQNLGLRTLPGYNQVHGGQTLDMANNSNLVLHELKIAGCHNLTSLGGVLQEKLPHLTKLSIQDCKELLFWPEEEGFQTTLLSLQEFSIENCPKLMTLPKGSILSPTLKKLTIKGSPSALDSSFFIQLQNMKNLTRPGDVYVEKQYQDLTCCSEEALKHMDSINWLMIQLIHQNVGGFPFVSFEYDIQPVGRRTFLDLVSYQRVSINIMRNSNGDEDDSTILSTCLRHHHLCSSLLSLCIYSMPYGAFHLPQGGIEEAFLGPNLEELVIVSCRDMRRLPVETMLRYLGKLKQLSLVDCLELTLPSVEAAIQSLPSLEKLVIIDCPTLSLASPDAHDDGSDNTMPSSPLPSATSSPFSSSSSPLIQSLAIDDVGLLANRQFTGKYFTSLRNLVIWYSGLISFPAATEEYLKSLRSLSFINCPNLQELQPDFRNLVPSLEALCIKECPKLRCMPEMGLPASLELLGIQSSPGLEDDDWPKVAHVRSIIMERKCVQGTYSDYQELVTKGKVALVPF